MFFSMFWTILTILWKPTNVERAWTQSTRSTRVSRCLTSSTHCRQGPGQNGTEDPSRVPVLAVPRTSHTCAGLVQGARRVQTQDTLQHLHSRTDVWEDEGATQTASFPKSVRNARQGLPTTSLLGAPRPGGPGSEGKCSGENLPLNKKHCHVVSSLRRSEYVLCTFASVTAKKILKNSKNKGRTYLARHQRYRGTKDTCTHEMSRQIIRCCLKLDSDGSNLWPLHQPTYKNQLQVDYSEHRLKVIKVLEKNKEDF